LLFPLGFSLEDDFSSSLFLPKVLFELEVLSSVLETLLCVDLFALLFALFLPFEIGSAFIFGFTLNPSIAILFIFCLINFSIANR
jgi:hypothetical protein